MPKVVDRRALLKFASVALLPIADSGRSIAADTPFTGTVVDELAADLARRPFLPQSYSPPGSLDTFGYDEYRDIRYRPEKAVWANGKASTLSLQFFLASFIYKDPVEIFLIDGGSARRFDARREMFDFGLSGPKVPPSGNFAFSGFRVHGALNSTGVNDEIAAFNGASYFRALGRGHSYGLSARGLALNTIGQGPEEFPRFRTFWVEQPEGETGLSFHALLDSPSVTGAYHFVLRPGAETITDVRVSLFPRKDLAGAGFAPLTSMFLFDSRNRKNFRDFRLAVHDSNGLAIRTAEGEHLWRPLLNPGTLQASVFEVNNPPGYGLVQRQREFAQFQDLEARYESRPSAWIEPVGEWGAGSVELLELPIGAEWGDNIVAYWRPAHPLEASKRYDFAYKIHWCGDYPLNVRRVINTFVGVSGGMPLFMIDYDKSTNEKDVPSAHVWASGGRATQPIVQNNPHTGGVRCFFSLEPLGQKLIDLRLTLNGLDLQPFSNAEVWTYRWLAD